MVERRNIGLLDDVFSIGVVTKHTSRDPIEAAIVTLHDAAEGVGIPGKRTPHQFGILQSDEAVRFNR
jgi:hypothetical protein